MSISALGTVTQIPSFISVATSIREREREPVRVANFRCLAFFNFSFVLYFRCSLDFFLIFFLGFEMRLRIFHTWNKSETCFSTLFPWRFCAETILDLRCYFTLPASFFKRSSSTASLTTLTSAPRSTSLFAACALPRVTAI